jgi:hypothetical protein
MSTKNNAYQWRKPLYRCVDRNNVSGTRWVHKKIKECGLKLTDSSLRDEELDASILHIALLRECWDIVMYLLIAVKDLELFTDSCRAPQSSFDDKG